MMLDEKRAERKVDQTELQWANKKGQLMVVTKAKSWAH